MADLVFNPEIANAATLDSSFYSGERALELENRMVFPATWQLVGRSEQVSEKGQYFTGTIANEPVIVARGADGTLRAFSNVCRHRAGPVADGAGTKNAFRCGYHGWTYGLDGRLLATPEFEGVECFTKAEHGLPQFRVEEWNNLIFVNIDCKAPPLSEFLGEMVDELAKHDLAKMRFAERKEWNIACNWKVYVDNYLEGYHIPVVHPSLNREIDYARYRTETRRYHSIQHSPLRPNNTGRIRQGGEVEVPEAQYYWLFPNLMLNVYPDNYSTNLIIPTGPETTVTIFEWYFADSDSESAKLKIRETIEFSDEIQIEDIRICEAVQRGLKSSTYQTGRYSVKRENGVHQFHGLLAEYLKIEKLAIRRATRQK